MAKILKVKIARTVSGNKTSRTYPNEYDSKKIDVLAYEFFGDQAGIDSRNDGYEYCIGVVSDADAPAFLASDSIVELSVEDALTQGAVWRPQQEKINDISAVISVCQKVRNSQVLDATDLKIIDPDDAQPGLVNSQSFTDLLTERLAR